MLAAAFLAGISFSNSSSSASIVTLIFCASSKSESCSGIGMRMGPACLSASMSISRESMGLACQAWRTRLHFGHPCLSLLFGFSPVETSTFLILCLLRAASVIKTCACSSSRYGSSSSASSRCSSSSPC